jgi:ABC-2 type transport system permease protein
MRGVLADGVLRFDHLAAAAGLNVLWLAAASYAFIALLNQARDAGSLLSSGE